MFKLFMHEIMRAFFIESSHDLNRAKEWLKYRGMSEEEIKRVHPNWFSRHVRRYIPPPLNLVKRLTAVYHSFSSIMRGNGK